MCRYSTWYPTIHPLSVLGKTEKMANIRRSVKLAPLSHVSIRHENEIETWAKVRSEARNRRRRGDRATRDGLGGRGGWGCGSPPPVRWIRLRIDLSPYCRNFVQYSLLYVQYVGILQIPPRIYQHPQQRSKRSTCIAQCHRAFLVDAFTFGCGCSGCRAAPSNVEHRHVR